MLEDIFSFGTCLVFIFTFCLGIILYNSITRTTGSPSGPRLFPVIGNAYLMLRKDTRNLFRELRDKYGDIYSLNVGYTHWIIINKYEILKELFVSNGELTSERPDLFPLTYKRQKFGIVSTSGVLWKTHRRFALRKLKHFGFGTAKIGKRIEIETKFCLSFIENINGKPFDIKNILLRSISNLMSSILFGIRSDEGDRSIEKIIETFDDNVGTPWTLLFMLLPFLKSVPWALKHIETFEKEKSILKNIYDNHLATFQEGIIRDFTDICIQEQRTNNKDGGSVPELQLIGIMRDLYQAGTETTTTALRWILIHLIRQPEIQDRIRAEIDDVVGKTRLPLIEDRPRMPYTEATLMEVLRLENIVPFAVMHSTKVDLMFRGIRLPKSAELILNLDSVAKDEKIWENPNEFNPSRFIDDNGLLVRKEEFIPFSLGRRICLGESLARSTLFLFLTSLIQRFELLPHDEDQVPGLDCVDGEFVHRPLPFELRAVLRK